MAKTKVTIMLSGSIEIEVEHNEPSPCLPSNHLSDEAYGVAIATFEAEHAEGRQTYGLFVEDMWEST